MHTHIHNTGLTHSITVNFIQGYAPSPAGKKVYCTYKISSFHYTQVEKSCENSKIQKFKNINHC